MEGTMMNGTEKQINYAMKIRADALNSLEPFSNIFTESNTFYGKNLRAIYSAGRALIESITDAGYMIENGAKIADETKAFAGKWEQHYNYCKQHGKKPHPAKLILKAAPAAAGCKYLTAEMIEEEM